VPDYSLEIKQSAQKEMDALDDVTFARLESQNSGAGRQSTARGMQKAEGSKRPMAHPGWSVAGCLRD